MKKPRGGQLTEAQVEANRLLNAIRVRIEHCIGWAKNWKIISTRFRWGVALKLSSFSGRQLEGLPERA